MFENWTIKVAHFKARDANRVFKLSFDYGRIISKDGVDYLELKNAKMEGNKRQILEASKFTNMLVDNSVILFEFNRGQFFQGEVQLVEQVVGRRSEKQEDGTFKEIEVLEYRPMVVPVIDKAADKVYVDQLKKNQDLFARKKMEDLFMKMMLGLGIVALCLIVVAWLTKDALLAAANTNSQAPELWAKAFVNVASNYTIIAKNAVATVGIAP